MRKGKIRNHEKSIDSWKHQNAKRPWACKWSEGGREWLISDRSSNKRRKFSILQEQFQYSWTVSPGKWCGKYQGSTLTASVDNKCCTALIVLYCTVRATIPVDRTMFLQISGMLENETKLEFLATSSEGSTVFKMNTASAVANLIKSKTWIKG